MQELIFILISAVICSSLAKEGRPNVQVYTRVQEEFGKDNILICHVTCFYPPLITIDLLKNGVEMLEANQTDLAFANSWKYHLTKSVPITLNQEDKFICRVTHMGKTNNYSLDLDE